MGATSLDLSQIKTDVLSAASTFRALIGLGNVNNTADLDKPISTATQTALDLKADSSDLSSYLPLAGGTLTGGLGGTDISLSGGINLVADFGWIGLSNTSTRFLPRAGSFRLYANTSLTIESNANDTSINTTLTTRQLYLRNSTNAMRMELFGTYTDASNYRRFYIGSTTAGAFTLGVEGLGTGASGNTLTIANAVTFGGSIIGTQIITNTNGFQTPIGGNGYAFNSGGYFICSSNGVFKFSNWADNDFGRLQLGGTTSSFPSIKRNGTAINFRLADDSADAPITAAAATFTGNITGNIIGANSGSYFQLIRSAGAGARFACETDYTWTIKRNDGSPNGLFMNLTDPPNQFLRLGNGAFLAWADTSGIANYGLALINDANNILAQRNSTNAQTFRLYNAYTDGSNYDRGFMRWNSNVFEIGTERAGTYSTTRNINLISGSMSMKLEGSSNGWGFYNSGFSILSGGTASASFGNNIGVTINNRLTFVEIATPTTPAANNVVIYAKDNGSGKTQLVVLMPDGIETVLATQT